MELVTLKGTGDGVKIYLSPSEDFALIIHALHDKLDEFRKFFGSGHCNIYIIGRELSASDRMRLEAVIAAMLPESTINYGERRLFRAEKRREPEEEVPEEAEQAEEEEASAEVPAEEPTIPVEQIKEVVTGNFKSSRARFFEGAVRKGRIVESDGHMVLMGTVEEGGRLVAAGNIIVMGGVYGEVEAGCRGSEGAYIAALDLSPSRITIAGRSLVPKRENDAENDGENNAEIAPKRAYLINNEIKTEKFWLK